ncbi:MAG: hypothetical protein E7773_08770 [Sphingomonas sp.]|uniref:hypothetical protein n=1 Tax=Sphingomonas sp. TaxID=28214 RepID=UPI0012274230|nr:hypothetical protein [Sphingomonas sp.]THD36023.1 MAG: hypothetical protein E7773_08770 [Sphingomonas sp.]
MSDAVPPLVLPAAEPATRRLTLATAAGIALITFLVGLVLAVWAIDHFRAEPQPAPQPQTVVAPAPKVIVAPPVATDPASLSARQEMLSAQLAALEQRSAAITSAAANAYGNASRAEALLVVLVSRRAIDRGLELGYLEQQLRDRFGATQPNEVATIIDASHHPVTTEDLRLGLDQIGPQLALGPAGEGGWGGAVWRLLGSLIVVHPRNTPSPVPSERLARVRRMLAQGQVEAAVEEVNKLPGAAQATGWMTGARQYVAARKALIVLETAAIQGRAATPPAPGASPTR